jgi:two-component system sensor histidine kinase KdpD
MQGMKRWDFERAFVPYWLTFWLVAGLAFFSGLTAPFIGYRAVGFIFLLGVIAVGVRAGLGAVVFAAALSAAVWNYFFIPPAFTLAISQPEDVMMCLTFFVVAVILGTLTAQLRRHEKRLREREESTNTLYLVTRDISESRGSAEILSRVCARTGRMLGGQCHVQNSKRANVLSIPLEGESANFGHLVFEPFNGTVTSRREALLRAIARQLAVALERDRLESTAREAERLKESEKLHQTLLNSISHELRTPLTAIIGSASALKDVSAPDSPAFRLAMAEELLRSAARLNRVIENLLDMSRLNSGFLALKKEWHDVRDLVGVTVKRLEPNIGNHPLELDIPDSLPLVDIDFRLVEHALLNLLINAVTYSPDGSVIRLSATAAGGRLILCVEDRGRGIPAGDLEKIFHKFYRVPGSPTGGTGLGLSIAQGIVEFHNGTLTAENRAGGGSRFKLTLPLGHPPEMPNELASANSNR